MFVFQKFFSQFWRASPKGDKLYSELISDFDTLLIDITQEWDNFVDEKNERNFAEFKQKLISSFEALWKMIAMMNFKQDLLTGAFYLEKELDEHFKFDINQAKEDLIEICSELNDMIPFEEPTDPLYQDFKTLIREGHKLSEQEQKKHLEQFHANVEKRKNSQ